MIYKETRCRWLNRKVLHAARHKSSLFLWLYNNLLPLNVCLVLRKTPVSIYILVLYIYKQFKSGLAAPPLGEVTCYSVYILTLSFIFFLFMHYLQNWKMTANYHYILLQEWPLSFRTPKSSYDLSLILLCHSGLQKVLKIFLNTNKRSQWVQFW